MDQSARAAAKATEKEKSSEKDNEVMVREGNIEQNQVTPDQSKDK